MATPKDKNSEVANINIVVSILGLNCITIEKFVRACLQVKTRIIILFSKAELVLLCRGRGLQTFALKLRRMKFIEFRISPAWFELFSLSTKVFVQSKIIGITIARLKNKLNNSAIQLV